MLRTLLLYNFPNITLEHRFFFNLSKCHDFLLDLVPHLPWTSRLDYFRLSKDDCYIASNDLYFSLKARHIIKFGKTVVRGSMDFIQFFWSEAFTKLNTDYPLSMTLCDLDRDYISKNIYFGIGCLGWGSVSIFVHKDIKATSRIIIKKIRHYITHIWC